MVENQLFITTSILKRVPTPIQNLMWYIAKLVKPNAKLHEFSLVIINDDESNQLLTHKIRDLNYVKKYRFKFLNPINETVCIVNNFASTMYLAEEYYNNLEDNYMDKEISCSECGNKIDSSDTYDLEGKIACEDCYEELAIVCPICGRTLSIEHAIYHNSEYYCSNCFDTHFRYCTECDAIISSSDVYYYEDEPYCENCYNKSNEYIKCYDYKPEPIFFGKGKKYMGVELEIDDGGEDNENARYIIEVANRTNNHIYIKHDGSIDDGMEIVSHPMSLDYHMNFMPWKDILSKAKNLGYLSHDTETSGLHVHVNKTFFGYDTEEQDERISRVLFFFENNWNKIVRFSRRTEDNIKRWAYKYNIKGNPKDILDKAKKSYSRYVCVNISNYYTIEFRVFRGTLKYNTLIATLQFVNEICNVAVSMSDDEIHELTWDKFVNRLDKNEVPELITYLKERKLYFEKEGVKNV